LLYFPFSFSRKKAFSDKGYWPCFALFPIKISISPSLSKSENAIALEFEVIFGSFVFVNFPFPLLRYNLSCKSGLFSLTSYPPEVTYKSKSLSLSTSKNFAFVSSKSLSNSNNF